MRIALVPTSGDPYVLGLWLRSFERFWRSAVDQVYAAISAPVEQAVLRAMLSRLRGAGVEPVVFPELRSLLPHGEAIARLLARCGDGNVLLLDEDALPLRAGEVDRHFRALEGGGYDIVGCGTANCSFGLYARSREVFGMEEPHFSPSFFFAGSYVFDWTDREFEGRRFAKGDYIAPLDLLCEQEEDADCFVWASIQMRARHPRVLGLGRWEGPEEADSPRFEEDPAWVHLGALGQGKEILVDDAGLTLALRASGRRGDMDLIDGGSPAYWEKKLAAWMICRRHFALRGEAGYYNELFDRALAHVWARKGAVISESRTHALIGAYSRLLAPVLA